MSDTGSTWLTQQGYEHVRNELNSMLLAYRSAEYHHNDPQALEEREWQERRIWQLQELLLTAEVGAQPPDDGIAEPGMVLTVRYADSDDTETFLLPPRCPPSARDRGGVLAGLTARVGSAGRQGERHTRLLSA